MTGRHFHNRESLPSFEVNRHPFMMCVKDGRQFIVEEKAELVRHNYPRHLEPGSVAASVKELDSAYKHPR
jgi:hypothetical protein